MVGAVLLCCAFLAGRLVTSPWEEAHENSERTVQVTAPVVRDELALPEVVLTGTVTLGDSLSVLPAPTGEGLSQVVTGVHVSAGDVVGSGDLLVEISDRPLVALHLAFPLFRDLHVGDTGSDVRAVQEALVRAGLFRGSADGVFGARTAIAVSELYRHAGAAPPPASSEATENLADLEAQVADRDAARAPQTGDDGVPLPVTPLTAGDKALDARLAAARDAAGPWVPMAEIVALTSVTMTVLSVAPVGTVLGDDVGPVTTLRGEGATARFRAGLADAPVFALGARAVVTAVDGTGGSATGEVVSVSDFAEPDEVEVVPGYDVVVQMDEPGGLADGSRVAVSPDVEVLTQEGLVVPILAVREDSEGTYVLVAELAPAGTASEPTPHRVAVSPGLQRDGMVIVEGDALDEGDRVVIGAAR